MAQKTNAGDIGRGLITSILHYAEPWDGEGLPPVNELVMVSANRGFTWFPIRLLWIGETSFVWRQMTARARPNSEIFEGIHYSNWLYRPFVDGMEYRSYFRDKETDDVWERIKFVSET